MVRTKVPEDVYSNDYPRQPYPRETSAGAAVGISRGTCAAVFVVAVTSGVCNGCVTDSSDTRTILKLCVTLKRNLLHQVTAVVRHYL